mgnify:CR=1 FL=1
MGQDAVTRDLRGADRPRRQAKRGGRDPDIGRLSQRMRVRGLLVEGAVLKRQIDVTAEQRFRQVLRQIDGQFHIDSGKAVLHLHQERAQPSLGDQLCHAKPLQPVKGSPVARGLQKPVHSPENAPRGAQQLPPLAGQTDRACIAVHQLQV